MTIEPEIKEAMVKHILRIKENKLLILGILFGIIVSLIAGVITDLIKSSSFYPFKYLIILTIIFFIIIFKLLVPYLQWKTFRFKLDKELKELKRVIDIGKEYHSKNDN